MVSDYLIAKDAKGDDCDVNQGTNAASPGQTEDNQRKPLSGYLRTTNSRSSNMKQGNCGSRKNIESVWAR